MLRMQNIFPKRRVQHIPGMIAEVIKGKYKHRNIRPSISHHLATGETQVGCDEISQRRQQMSSPLRREASRGILMTLGAETEEGARGKGRRVGRGQMSRPAVGSLHQASSGGRERSQPPAKGHGGWAASSQPLTTFTDILTKMFGMFVLTHMCKQMLGFFFFFLFTASLCHWEVCCERGRWMDRGTGPTL